MAILRKLLGATAATLLSLSAHASLVTVQGVTWDPDSVVDFQSSFNFSQWFQNGIAFAPTAAGSVVAFTDPYSLVGTYVTGSGKMNTFNGVNQIPGDPNPETTPAVFAPGRELTYIYGGIKITGVTVNGASVVFTFDVSNSYITVYSDSSKNYSETLGGLAEQVDAADSDFSEAFLTGKFEEFNVESTLGTTSGRLFGDAQGLISLTGGAAYGNFSTDSEQSFVNPAVFADLTFTGSAQINSGASISTVGSGELQGNTVPEPASVALAGLALLGGFAASRKRKA